MSIYNKKIKFSDYVITAMIFFSAAISVLLLAGILVYVFIKGAPAISLPFLFSVQSALKNSFGILGNIVNTLYIIVITLLIATPVGIGAAIYLNEYAKRGRLVRLIEFTTETLSGIPSIIYGLFGMVFFGISLHLGFSILCGSLTLSLMVMPIIIRTTQEALKAVPDSYRNAALGMGAEKWHSIRTVVLPCSLPGIITAIILSIGRIIGESAALLFTAGSAYVLPKALFGHVFSSAGTLTIQLYLSMSNADYSNAFGIALVLIIIVLIINFLTKAIAGKRAVN